MLNIRSIISSVLNPVPPAVLSPLPVLSEDQPDRIDIDLVGLSDMDAMWYYETRRWRGRD